jgi:hypothetical protein
MIVCCWIENLKFNANSSYIFFGFLNFYVVPFFLMSQVFEVWISECPSFWVKHFENPTREDRALLFMWQPIGGGGPGAVDAHVCSALRNSEPRLNNAHPSEMCRVPTLHTNRCHLDASGGGGRHHLYCQSRCEYDTVCFGRCTRAYCLFPSVT